MNFSSDSHILLAVHHPRAPEGAAFVMETGRWDPATWSCRPSFWEDIKISYSKGPDQWHTLEPRSVS